jgi:hypothetical protein
MKTWEKPDLCVLNVNETAHGAKSATNVDKEWDQELDGEWATIKTYWPSGENDGAR